MWRPAECVQDRLWTLGSKILPRPRKRSSGALVRPYLVMFAGPSDAADERRPFQPSRSFRLAVDSCNRLLQIAGTSKAVLQVFWRSHYYAGLPDGRAATRHQDEINRQLLDTADALIAVFRDRVGTQSARAGSGTQEEVEQARLREIPLLVCFYKGGADAGESDHRPVDDYRRYIEQYCLPFVYQTEDELQSHLTEWLFALCWKHKPASRASKSARLSALVTISKQLAEPPTADVAGILYTIAGDKTAALLGVYKCPNFATYCGFYGWRLEIRDDTSSLHIRGGTDTRGGAVFIDESARATRYVIDMEWRVVSLEDKLGRHLDNIVHVLRRASGRGVK
jgi:hypothetical protein